MFGPLGFVVHLVGGVGICLADLHDPACPALVEVELSCANHPGGWAVHVWPLNPPAFQPYVPTNRLQAELTELFARHEAAR